jgi:hypothetical protein
MSFKITAESDLWESRGTFTLTSPIYFWYKVVALGANKKPFLIIAEIRNFLLLDLRSNQNNIFQAVSAGAPLMASSDLRGQVVELKRPDSGNLKKDTVNGILRVSSGELAGQLAFFPRHCLHLFGHNMHKANLMDVTLPKEEFCVELVG